MLKIDGEDIKHTILQNNNGGISGDDLNGLIRDNMKETEKRIAYFNEIKL